MRESDSRDRVDADGDGSLVSILLSPKPAAEVRRAPVSASNRRRRLGTVIGVFLGISALGVLIAPGKEHLTAPGKMNTGHASLGCDDCHRPAPGTIRQQLQANVRYLLGQRTEPADFGERDVENADCLSCHERPLDRHPTFRFNEPRFAEVRKTLAPERCESCHREHSGVRVTVEPGYCSHCHAGLKLDRDPIDVSHEKLVREARWQSCLGCHDFHGNHVMQTPTRVAQATEPAKVLDYFAGSGSLYSTRLHRRALQERLDLP